MLICSQKKALQQTRCTTRFNSSTIMDSAIIVLHVAEPELGVKAIVRRLGAQHQSIDTRTVRDSLQKMIALHRQRRSRQSRRARRRKRRRNRLRWLT